MCGEAIDHQAFAPDPLARQHSVGVSRKPRAIAPGARSILAGCVDQRPTVAIKRPCNDRAAASLVSGGKPTDAEAMKLTNAKTVGQIEPGQMVTHDYRADRVTIETNPSSGRVVSARCG
ncbi:I78 family peptidase inhibitor [Rhizobium terrae]|uniref:I78 family peptidase inhibitor n=1 Tax=Rhizobium terrae TaxID=2171756 RepID=UPI001D0070DC|nr:I78 family peptidase inhibitor [Rhizobium terrae]